MLLNYLLLADASPADRQSFLSQADLWMHTVLVWIGFGTLVGLFAKWIMPGRDPGGAIATLVMGIGGSVIGCGILSYLSRGAHVSPISPLGFVVATAGAFVILGFVKLFAGRIVREAGDGPERDVELRPATRSRRKRATVLED
jgi:uncharacterized membrane protein YeaQ/YmgE (transglycosylase-associated protein family)